MAQWLTALVAALPEFLNSIPRKLMVAHDYLYWDLIPFGKQESMQTEHSKYLKWINKIYLNK